MHSVYLLLVLTIQRAEDKSKQTVYHMYSLIHSIITSKLHLEIQSREFSQMSMGMRVLRPEHWSNLKYALIIGTNHHLLVQLWRLS